MDIVFIYFITLNKKHIQLLFSADDCSTNIFNGCTAWTGGNDLNVEGEYVWDHSNTTMVFTNWHTNEPSLTSPSLATTRDCIDILRNGKWNDRPCLHLNSFICEKSIDF